MEKILPEKMRIERRKRKLNLKIWEVNSLVEWRYDVVILFAKVAFL